MSNVCNHGETSDVCGACDAEVVLMNERLRVLERKIDEGNFYDDPSSVMEPLWEERDQLKKELGLK